MMVGSFMYIPADLFRLMMRFHEAMLCVVVGAARLRLISEELLDLAVFLCIHITGSYVEYFPR